MERSIFKCSNCFKCDNFSECEMVSDFLELLENITNGCFEKFEISITCPEYKGSAEEFEILELEDNPRFSFYEV